MKRFSVLIFLFTVSLFTVNGQWVEQQTNQTEMVVTEFSPVGDNVNWALDLKWPNRQTFSKTVDGGDHWVTGNFNLQTTSAYRIRTIFALNADTAWIPVIFETDLQKSGVYKTTDGGVTWEQQTTSYNTNNPGKFPSLVYFWNAHEGVTVGSIDTATMRFDIFVTTDGGAQWNKIPDIDNPPSTAEDYRLPPLSCRRFRVVGNTIWFITLKNKIYKSTDRGYHWVKYDTPAQSDYMNLADCVFAFQDENNGLMIDSYCNTPYKYKLYETNDGAQTWHEKQHQGTPLGWDLNHIPGTTATYASSGYTQDVTTSGLCYTEDGGATWIKHPSFNGLLTGVVVFPNNKTGWIGSEDGRVYRTQNFKGENPAITHVAFSGKTTVEVLFNHPLDENTALDTANYSVIQSNPPARRWVAAVSADPPDHALVRLTLAEPAVSGKEYKIYPTSAIKDTSGFMVLSGGFMNQAIYLSKQIRFIVEADSLPAESVIISLNDSVLMQDTLIMITDSSGIAVFEVDPGVYSYRITKQGFSKITGIIQVDVSDTILSIPVDLTSSYGIHSTGKPEPEKVFPNPASTCLYLADDAEADLEVYSITGELIEKQHKPPFTRAVGITHLKPGLYLFRIKRADSQQTVKVQIIK